MRPLTVSWAKGMIPVANKPILSYIVDALKGSGILDIVMVVGYKKERVMSHFGDGSDFGVNIEYVVQRSPTGTAHAVLTARKNVDGDFLVMPGDNLISQQGIQSLLDVKKGDAAVLFTRSNTPSKYGVIGIEGDRVSSIVEKPKISGALTTSGIPSMMSLAMWEDREKTLSDLISTGIYRFNPEVFKIIEDLKEEGESKLTNVLQTMIDCNMKVQAVQTDSWVDAVYPWDLLKVNSTALTFAQVQKAGTVQDGVTIMGRVGIGKDTIIKSGSYIEGPVVVGENCELGPNVHVAGPSAIGENVTIGPFTTIQNSILMNDVQIGPGATIMNSVIAPGTRIGANFCIQKGGATVQLSGENPLTVSDIGAIIGEDCLIGQNVVATPGTIVGAGCSVNSLRILRENLPDGSKVV